LRMRVSRATDLAAFRHGARVKGAGAVVVRQRPGTARVFGFLNLEDETGLVNVIVRPALFHRHRLALVNEHFLLIEGTLQRQDNVTSIRAERLAPLRHRLGSVPSPDFHYRARATRAGTRGAPECPACRAGARGPGAARGRGRAAASRARPSAPR